MHTLGDEDDLLEDVKEGVEIAMHRQGYGEDAVDPIKLNKLAYFAIREFELPITYGWYKYGPAPVNVARQVVDPSPRPSEEVAAADEPRIRNLNHQNRSPEEYSYFYAEDLAEFERILETPTKEYLVTFYFEHAPDEFRDLYIASVELQQVLDEIKDDPSWHDEGDEYVALLERRFPRLIREVRSNPRLQEAEAREAIERYEQLFTDVVTTASRQSELTEAQQRFIGRLVDTFYGGAWNYVALLVSRATVDLSPGTNQQQLRNSIERDLQDIRTECPREHSRLAERATQFDLRSDSTESNSARTDGDQLSGDAGKDFDDENTASLEEIRQKLE